MRLLATVLISANRTSKPTKYVYRQYATLMMVLTRSNKLPGYLLVMYTVLILSIIPKCNCKLKCPNQGDLISKQTVFNINKQWYSITNCKPESIDYNKSDLPCSCKCQLVQFNTTTKVTHNYCTPQACPLFIMLGRQQCREDRCEKLASAIDRNLHNLATIVDYFPQLSAGLDLKNDCQLQIEKRRRYQRLRLRLMNQREKPNKQTTPPKLKNRNGNGKIVAVYEYKGPRTAMIEHYLASSNQIKN